MFVWDLRLIRQQLKELGMDWDWPEFPAFRVPGSKPVPRFTQGRAVHHKICFALGCVRFVSLFVFGGSAGFLAAWADLRFWRGSKSMRKTDCWVIIRAERLRPEKSLGCVRFLLVFGWDGLRRGLLRLSSVVGLLLVLTANPAQVCLLPALSQQKGRVVSR